MPALAQAAAMPLLEETTLPQEHPPTVPVVIIGKCFVLTFDGFTLLLLTTNILNLKNTGQETKPRFPQTGFVFRQRTIRYLSVLPAEWIQALPRYGNCPPEPNTLQETAGD